MSISQYVIDDIIPHIIMRLNYNTMINYLASCKQLYDTVSADILLAVRKVVENLAHKTLRELVIKQGDFSSDGISYEIKLTGPDHIEHSMFRRSVWKNIVFSDNFYSEYNKNKRATQ